MTIGEVRADRVEARVGERLEEVARRRRLTRRRGSRRRLWRSARPRRPPARRCRWLRRRSPAASSEAADEPVWLERAFEVERRRRHRSCSASRRPACLRRDCGMSAVTSGSVRSGLRRRRLAGLRLLGERRRDACGAGRGAHRGRGALARLAPSLVGAPVAVATVIFDGAVTPLLLGRRPDDRLAARRVVDARGRCARSRRRRRARPRRPSTAAAAAFVHPAMLGSTYWLTAAPMCTRFVLCAAIAVTSSLPPPQRFLRKAGSGSIAAIFGAHGRRATTRRRRGRPGARGGGTAGSSETWRASLRWSRAPSAPLGGGRR